MDKKITYSMEIENTCAKNVSFSIINNEILCDVKFDGGCEGNRNMISKLLENKKIEDVIDILKGNMCGKRGTSCADQLGKSIEKALTIYLSDKSNNYYYDHTIEETTEKMLNKKGELK